MNPEEVASEENPHAPAEGANAVFLERASGRFRQLRVDPTTSSASVIQQAVAESKAERELAIREELDRREGVTRERQGLQTNTRALLIAAISLVVSVLLQLVGIGVELFIYFNPR